MVWDWYKPYSVRSVRRWEVVRDFFRPQQWRVVRGGSFVDSPLVLRFAFRDRIHPGIRFGFRGFRCVRVPPQPID
jgi:formylglycine-generating enzyme required for sulfatase activity